MSMCYYIAMTKMNWALAAQRERNGNWHGAHKKSQQQKRKDPELKGQTGPQSKLLKKLGVKHSPIRTCAEASRIIQTFADNGWKM